MPDLPTPDSKLANAPSATFERNGLRLILPGLVAPAGFLFVGLLLIVAVGIAQRMGWMTVVSGTGEDGADAPQTTHTCPMHPQIRQPGTGRCPICGMELVPAASGAADLDELAVQIEPAQRRLANIATEAAVLEPVTATIETIGAIAIDESRMATIASYVDGRLERLFADYTGVDVAQDDHLAVVYSPDLYAAQVEYIETRASVTAMTSATLSGVRQAQQKLLDNTKQKLTELGMQPTQIERLEKTGKAQSRLTIYSPIGGTVIEKQALEGKYIEAGEAIYRIADLSTVWLMLELYPEDAAHVRFGQRVDATVQSLPGEHVTGRVAFVSPTVAADTRTVSVRVEFLNEERRIRPGDYASATIHLPIGNTGDVYDDQLAGRWISPMHPQIIRDGPGDCPICGMKLVPTSRYGYSATPVDQPASLSVPRSAVLMAGNSSVIYVEDQPGRFEIRPVTIGPILRDRVIILDGISVGEKVATAGNFLIDSQMQLAGKPSLIDPTRAIAAANQRNDPLQLDRRAVTRIDGPVSRQLEQLYDSYFELQKALASDQLPTTQKMQQLHDLAHSLSDSTTFDDSTRQLLAEIATHAEHLHHMSLQEARHDAFRPISHAVVALAATVRSADFQQPFHHMFCPMVKGGAGDWLQRDDKLINPYWGSQMLHCGETVQTFGNAMSVEDLDIDRGGGD